jgi:hypothetical protein
VGSGWTFSGSSRTNHHSGPTGGAPAQSHLDFIVDDLMQAERNALALGATKPDFQPGGADFAFSSIVD